jgi:hypothetical protein
VVGLVVKPGVNLGREVEHIVEDVGNMARASSMFEDSFLPVS